MIYLDYAATHPMTPGALAAYARAAGVPGNPASIHRAGQAARELLEEGRAAAASALGVPPLTLTALSGGTEADNQVLLSSFAEGGGHLITSSIEHSAVLAPARWLAARGVDVTFLTPDASGRIDPDEVRRALRPDTRLVSLHHANNEIGALQDVAALAEVAHLGGAKFHTDAVQAPGVVPLALMEWGVDYASFSAHKWGGPLGVGLLYVRRGLELPPLLLGGGQEKGLRSGTQNAPGLYAAGLSLREAVSAQPQTHAHLRSLNDRLTARLSAEANLHANHTPEGSPKVASFTARGADGEALLMNLDLAGVCVSAGSACSAGTMQPSHVLLALGLSEADARATVRLSFGAATTTEEIDTAAEALIAAARASTA
ncbi:cysteine desulfurase NifS [Deinococcus irradiatisoli]|uniref:cysteine desulfurase n=1 Tax=Deinococcus irradiatisoli TaxID=2202254 RepID=A0A2Z3JPI3_9DEIO|nr:cysteine desulfurase family protein [Deinococcus irradiatisoli]AWN23408.1 cysteine desulfurase NifS [Deinococcus irradiatisoli]